MGRASRERWRAFRWRMAMLLAPWDDPSDDPHETVDADGIAVDKGVVSLVRWCWSNGIETHGSCEGAPKLWDIQRARSAQDDSFAAHICVASSEDALAVARNIQPFCEVYPKVSFYEDGSVFWFVAFDPRAVGRWDASADSVVELRDTCAPRMAGRQTS